MNKMTLLRWQKNEVLEKIKKEGLEPFNFKWSEIENPQSKKIIISRLSYGGNYFFNFEFHNDERNSFYSPAFDRLLISRYPETWETQLQDVEDWLLSIHREINEPDLWGEIDKYQLPPDSNIAPNETNTPFTFQEVQKIFDAVHQIKIFVSENWKLNIEQYEIVNKKLDYLVAAAERQGRIDWFHTSIGVIVSITIYLAQQPEQFLMIWTYIREALAGMIKFLP